jgi:GNAT superfamily N-acetyltransferase
MDIVELRKLEDELHRQALECILKTVEISNSPDYPQSVIEYQLQAHYTMDWIRKQMQSSYFIVALIEGKVVGTGSLDGDEIKAVFADPGHQRRGIGRAMMENLEEYARTMGLKEVMLKSSITAYDFYKRLGYRLVEELSEELLGDSVFTYLMKKPV